MPKIIQPNPIPISVVNFSPSIHTENKALKIRRIASAIGVTKEESYFSNK
jgi:hypothetical protein